jgi:hypothetical protein
MEDIFILHGIKKWEVLYSPRFAFSPLQRNDFYKNLKSCGATFLKLSKNSFIFGFIKKQGSTYESLYFRLYKKMICLVLFVVSSHFILLQKAKGF